MSTLTTEQIIKIIGEGSYELGLHYGRCEVLENLKVATKSCDDSGEPWILTNEELIKWAKEEFDINIK